MTTNEYPLYSSSPPPLDMIDEHKAYPIISSSPPPLDTDTGSMFPVHSSSPPPLEMSDDLSNNEDDDFGDFVDNLSAPSANANGSLGTELLNKSSPSLEPNANIVNGAIEPEYSVTVNGYLHSSDSQESVDADNAFEKINRDQDFTGTDNENPLNAANSNKDTVQNLDDDDMEHGTDAVSLTHSTSTSISNDDKVCETCSHEDENSHDISPCDSAVESTGCNSNETNNTDTLDKDAEFVEATDDSDVLGGTDSTKDNSSNYQAQDAEIQSQNPVDMCEHEDKVKDEVEVDNPAQKEDDDFSETEFVGFQQTSQADDVSLDFKCEQSTIDDDHTKKDNDNASEDSKSVKDCVDVSVHSEDEDDFGDFGQFSAVQSEDVLTFRTSSVEVEEGADGGVVSNVDDNFGDVVSKEKSEVDIKSEDDESEWADFNTASDNKAAADETNCDKEEDGDGDWAAFTDAPTPQEVGDDDEFEDFEEAPKPEASIQQSHTDLLSKLDDHHLKKLVTKEFPEDDINGNRILVDSIFQLMLQQKSMEEQSKIKSKERQKIGCLWNNLKQLETTNALQYTWSKSVHNQKLLAAINIDTRNILGRSKKAVPIYASQMSGMLEPHRGDENNSCNARLDVTDIDTNNALGTQEIPPVEFDWSSSGLTNPLDSLENELLKSIEPTPQQQPRTLQPLDDIIASMKVTPTTKQDKPINELSIEAQALLASLPDISYMSSSVLMFAVHGGDTQP